MTATDRRCGSRGARRHVARVSQRRARCRQRQPAGTCTRPHRNGSVVQREPSADREHPFRTARTHRRCGAVRQRARAADQRPVARFSQSSRARHPDGLECGRSADVRPDLLGLDVRLCERRRAGRAFGWVGTESKHGRHAAVMELRPCKSELRGYRAAREAPDASTASRASCREPFTNRASRR